MKTSLFVKASLLCVTLALAGCASKVTSPEKYSGFLKDYSGLQETTSASGKTVMRWVAPGFDFNQYDSLVYNPVVYYPIPKPNTQIGEKVLSGILNYTNQQLKTAAAARKPLVTTPGPRSLIFRGAITGVDSSKKGCSSMKSCRLRWWLPGRRLPPDTAQWTPTFILKVS